MTLEFAYALDTGRARKNNEDSVALDAQAQVAVLADGMGGYNAGEVAAGMATSIVCTSLAKWLDQNSESTPGDVGAAMAGAVDQANRAIFDAANSNPQARERLDEITGIGNSSRRIRRARSVGMPVPLKTRASAFPRSRPRTAESA